MPTPRLTAPRRSGLVSSLAAAGVSLLAWMIVAATTGGALVWQPSPPVTALLIELASTVTVLAGISTGLWWLALRTMHGQRCVSARVDRHGDTLDAIGGSLSDLHGIVEDLATQVATLRRDATGRADDLVRRIGEYGEHQWAAGYEARDADTGRGKEPELSGSTFGGVRPIRPRTIHHDS